MSGATFYAMLGLVVVGLIALRLIVRSAPNRRKQRLDGGGGDANSWSDACASDGDGGGGD